MIIKVIKVFIICNYNSKYLNEVINAYQNTFAGPPWFENWKFEEVKDIINEAVNKDNFLGKVLLKNYKNNNINNIDNSIKSKVLGFVFGYKVPNKNTQTVDFKNIYSNLEKINREDSFYLAECGIIQEEQNKGLGKILFNEFQKDVPSLIFRTINENMIKLVENSYNQKAQNLFYDPKEKSRIWYGVKK